MNNLEQLMINQPVINIGTLGSVSEGKSTLVKKLSGIVTQCHSREKIRNITIKQGYGNMKIFETPEGVLTTQEDGSENKLVNHISWVDCPGHMDRIQTALGSISLMDGVILIIGVKDKLEMKPQLIQHLLGIKMAGIKRLIVCLNKIDLVSKDVLLEYKKEVDALFDKYGIKPNYIIPTSFNKGIGLNWILNAIQELFNPTLWLEKTKDTPILKISRSFDINKPGMDWSDIKGGVIGGTITSGQFKVGDVIEIKPGRINKRTGVAIPIKTIIKSIQTGSTNLDVGYAGGLVAIGTDIDPFETKNDGLVGNICGVVNTLPETVSEISFDIEWIDKPAKLDNLSLLIGTRMCKAILDNTTFKLEKPMCILDKEQIIVCQDINGTIKVIGVKQ